MIVMRIQNTWSGPNGPLHRLQNLLLLCSCSSHDVHNATTAAGAEFDSARGQGEQGVVAATAYAGARVEVGATLADDDLPAETTWPPKRLTPRYWALESRPLRVELAPFLCAI